MKNYAFFLIKQIKNIQKKKKKRKRFTFFSYLALCVSFLADAPKFFICYVKVIQHNQQKLTWRRQRQVNSVQAPLRALAFFLLTYGSYAGKREVRAMRKARGKV